MGSRIIYTCDLCGTDVDKVYPLDFRFGTAQIKGWLYKDTQQMIQIAKEQLKGEACLACMISLVEELRNRFPLKYEVHE